MTIQKEKAHDDECITRRAREVAHIYQRARYASAVGGAGPGRALPLACPLEAKGRQSHGNAVYEQRRARFAGFYLSPPICWRPCSRPRIQCPRCSVERDGRGYYPVYLCRPDLEF